MDSLNPQTPSTGNSPNPPGATIDCFDPATRKPLGTVQVDSSGVLTLGLGVCVLALLRRMSGRG